jgi:ligand-binding sensor domain-containing protein
MCCRYHERIVYVTLFVLGLLTALVRVVNAERLPIKTYTTADGLPHSSIHRIVRDSRGFLWFCTGDGLSRFDGLLFRQLHGGGSSPLKKSVPQGSLLVLDSYFTTAI